MGRWKNQYIELCESIPEILLSCKERIPQRQEISFIKDRCTQPTIIECGSGSGSHLIERALKDSTHTYIGFEKRYKRAFRTAEKAKSLGLKNCLIVRGDVFNLKEFFERSSISGIYINFPDPWDRKRWEKHRMLSAEMLKVYADLLIDGGFLRYKTDHLGYFNDTIMVVSSEPALKIVEKTTNLYESAFISDNIPTEFEQLFQSQGISVCYLKIVKTSNHCYSGIR